MLTVQYVQKKVNEKKIGECIHTYQISIVNRDSTQNDQIIKIALMKHEKKLEIIFVI